jgi:hypothetical protein
VCQGRYYATLIVALAAWAGEKALPPLDEPPEEPEFTRLVLA